MPGSGTGTFGAGSEIFIGYEPTAVVAGDFNGDGISDLAATVSGANSVAILISKGAAGLAPPEYFGTSIEPSSLAVGDFNVDGKADLVSTHFNANVISVLLGDEAGAFASSSTELSGGARLAAGDFNGDGKPDLAIVSPPSIEIRLNNGAGGLSSPTYIQLGKNPRSIVIDDLNHDGKADLVVGHEFYAEVSVLLGNGAGGFSAPVTIAAPGGGGIIYGGDFNGDHNLDLAMTSSNNGVPAVAIMLGNGAGGFGSPSYIAVGGAPSSLAPADLNGDGKLDLAIANSYQGTLTILLGDGAGGFATAPYPPLHPASRSDFVTTGDLNKDGRIDLITANGEPNTVSVLLNNGSGFDSPVTFNPGTSPRTITVADFNIDGHPDLAVAMNSYAGNIAILNGDGLGNFSSPTFFVAGGAPNDLNASDFNGDGKPDLAVAGTPITSPNITLLLNTFKFQPCLSVEDAEVTESTSAVSNLVFTVNLSAAQSQPVKVNYILKENTAKSGVDYQHVSGRLVFAPGVTQQTVTVPIAGDELDEFDENLYLLLSNPANAGISRGQATGTIVDNDPEPTISIDDVSLAEGNFGSQNRAVFSLTLSAPSAKQISVTYAIGGGTATANSDYFFSAFNPIVVPPGTTKVNLIVSYGGENTYETDETFFINLSNPVNATIARGQGKGTILNDDPIPSIQMTNSFIEMEGANGPYNVFNVTLSHPSYQTITVNYATADGTAVAGSDYGATTGTVTINPGQTTQSVAVQVIDDNVDELTETFFMNLSSPVNATISTGQSQGQGLIYDNDGPTISINDVTVVEGNAGTVNANFTVTLSAPSVESVHVKYVTLAGTATSNVDYQRVTSSFTNLTIPAGATSATATVKGIGDSQIEPDETFSVILSDPISGTIADGQGVCTILDDDASPSLQLSQSSYSIGEAGGSAQVVVTRTNTSAAATVNYATSDTSGLNACNSVTGIASSRCDYALSIGTLRFAAGESSKTIFIPIIDDNIADGNETFTLTLSNPSGATLGTTTSAVVTITDNANTGGNPIDGAAFFIRQHYIDFLGREPEPAGLAGWLNVYNNCGTTVQQPCDRTEISSAFFRSEEFQTRASFVYRFYSAVGKIPLYEGFMPDFAKVSGFLSAQELEANKVAFVQEFMTRSDYQNLYGSISGNDAYVTALLNTLGLPNHARKAEWVTALNGGASRATVLRSVTEDGQVSQKYYNEAFVIMQYFGYLRRSADISYLNWIALMNSNGGDYRQMIDGFLNSAEYRNRSQ